MRDRRAGINWERVLLIGTPYLWLLVFFLLPFAIVAKISL